MDNLNLIAKYYYKTYRPDGRSDNGGRWYPSDTEKCSCCDNIRSPSHAYPWSLYKHCYSMKHIKKVIIEKQKKLSSFLPEAITMTRDTAPLYLNTDSDLLKFVRDTLLGVYKGV
jgi:hypothetical protein